MDHDGIRKWTIAITGLSGGQLYNGKAVATFTGGRAEACRMLDYALIAYGKDCNVGIYCHDTQITAGVYYEARAVK